MLDQETKVKISVDAPGAARAFNQIRIGADGAQQSLKDMAAGAAKTATALVAIGGAAAVAFGVKAIKDTARLADETGKLAQKAGTTAQSFSELAYAARLAGVGTDPLQKALAQLAEKLDTAKRGGKEAVELFNRLKLDPNNYRDSADALKAVAERFAKMPDGIEKTAIAKDIGKAWVDLIPLLNGGSAGIAAMAEEAARLGIVIDGEVAKQAEQFNDDLSRLGAAAEGAKISFATKLFPALTDIAKASADAAREGGVLNGIWVGLGATMAHILGLDEASKLRGRLEGVNQEIERVQKQLASGSLNPEGASDRFWSFLVPDVKLNEKAKQRLQQALTELQQERDRLLGIMSPVADADKSRTDAMVRHSETVAEAKEMELRRLQAVFAAQKQGLKAAEQDFENARKKREGIVKEFQQLQQELAQPTAGTGKNILGFEIEKAVDDARKAQQLAQTAPASQAGQLADQALEKARAAGELLKQYKAQQQEAGSSIDANAAQQLVDRLGGDLAKIADQAAGVQEKLAADQVATMQKIIQDTLGQAEALKNLQIGFDGESAKASLQSMLEQLRQQAIANPIKVPAIIVTGSLPDNLPGVDELPKRAYGGFLPGRAAHDRADNMLYWGTPGEFVLQRPAVRHYGAAFLSALNQMRLPKYANGGMLSRLSVPGLPSSSAQGRSSQSLRPINITFPQIGTFPFQAKEDVAKEVLRVLNIEALKYGGRR